MLTLNSFYLIFYLSLKLFSIISIVLNENFFFYFFRIIFSFFLLMLVYLKKTANFTINSNFNYKKYLKYTIEKVIEDFLFLSYKQSFHIINKKKYFSIK